VEPEIILLIEQTSKYVKQTADGNTSYDSVPKASRSFAQAALAGFEFLALHSTSTDKFQAVARQGQQIRHYTKFPSYATYLSLSKAT
jgi:hypothetical protein